MYSNKMKNKECNTIRTVPKYNTKIVEKHTSNTEIHDSSFFWHGTGTSIFKWQG